MTVFRTAQHDSKHPSADALGRFQESITKSHWLLLEQATIGETENSFCVAILKLQSILSLLDSIILNASSC